MPIERAFLDNVHDAAAMARAVDGVAREVPETPFLRFLVGMSVLLAIPFCDEDDADLLVAEVQHATDTLQGTDEETLEMIALATHTFLAEYVEGRLAAHTVSRSFFLVYIHDISCGTPITETYVTRIPLLLRVLREDHSASRAATSKAACLFFTVGLYAKEGDMEEVATTALALLARPASTDRVTSEVVRAMDRLELYATASFAAGRGRVLALLRRELVAVEPCRRLLATLCHVAGAYALLGEYEALVVQTDLAPVLREWGFRAGTVSLADALAQSVPPYFFGARERATIAALGDEDGVWLRLHRRLASRAFLEDAAGRPAADPPVGKWIVPARAVGNGTGFN